MEASARTNAMHCSMIGLTHDGTERTTLREAARRREQVAVLVAREQIEPGAIWRRLGQLMAAPDEDQHVLLPRLGQCYLSKSGLANTSLRR